MSTQKIGRYEVREELGRGGMATVFRAYDPNFERDVAIKVLPEVFLHDPQFRVRFEREAKTIALLEHPAIVPVYDFGESGGQPYIVMRYMSGGTLGDRLKQGALSLDETSRLISRLAPALDAAHARGIIHRDIKPGNILFDQYGNAFLSDFGIAHLGMEGLTTMTGGSALGTPAYMSPEQIQGDKKVDGRSDIYALGVLVYQMLTGLMPYSADTPAKVMMMHVLQPVPQILQVRPDLPVGCDAIITQAMAKEPNDRFPTAGEFAEALDLTARYSTGSGATPPPLAYTTPTQAATTAVVGGTIAAQPTIKSPSGVETIAGPAKEVIPVERKGGMSRGVIIGIVVAIIVVAGGIGAFLFSRQNQSSQAALGNTPTLAVQASTEITLQPTETSPAIAILPATDTPTPEPTEAPTLEPTATQEPTRVANQFPGGADKIAYLDGKNIWVADLDGSDRTQVTIDGASKINLQWSEDGKQIYYITGKCIQSVNIETTAIDNINCFNFTTAFKSFQISPDFKQVAISVDNQLYLVPFDLDKIREVKRRSDLTAMAECKDFAPYTQVFVEGSQWSEDNKYLALLILAPMADGKRGNLIQVTEIDTCTPTPNKVNTFPGSTFIIEDYSQNPVIQNFGFDGYTLFALNNIKRNEGFGDLYAYNTELRKAYLKINPINGRCCYRDTQFSPDGSYVVFAFQDLLQGSNSVTKLYMIPYGTIGTGAEYTPMPLPDITDPREKPQPILRPALP
jgi:serine/threonine-protein kinase